MWMATLLSSDNGFHRQILWMENLFHTYSVSWALAACVHFGVHMYSLKAALLSRWSINELTKWLQTSLWGSWGQRQKHVGKSILFHWFTFSFVALHSRAKWIQKECWLGAAEQTSNSETPYNALWKIKSLVSLTRRTWKNHWSSGVDHFLRFLLKRSEIMNTIKMYIQMNITYNLRQRTEDSNAGFSSNTWRNFILHHGQTYLQRQCYTEQLRDKYHEWCAQVQCSIGTLFNCVPAQPKLELPRICYSMYSLSVWWFVTAAQHRFKRNAGLVPQRKCRKTSLGSAV